MNLLTYIEAERGRAARLAKSMGKSASFVTQMAHGKRPVPALHAVAIERDTGGQVRRWDMRPEDWHLLWPNLIGTEGAPAPAELEHNHAQ